MASASNRKLRIFAVCLSFIFSAFFVYTAGAAPKKIPEKIKDEVTEYSGQISRYKNLRPIELTDLTWYAKKGFNKKDAVSFDFNDSDALQVKTFPVSFNRLFDIPPGRTTNHFTFAAKFDLKKSDLPENLALGIYIPVVGENWEVFLNGHLLKSETYLAQDGSIASRRTLRRVIIPFDQNILNKDGNVLVMHFAGEAPVAYITSHPELGLPFRTDFKISALAVLTNKISDIVAMNLNGIFLLCGAFFIGFYFVRKMGVYNLYFGIFCFMLATRFFAKSDYLYQLILDTGIIFRIEVISTFFMLPPFILFLYCFFLPEKKVKLSIKIITAITVVFALVAAVAPYRIFFATLRVWQLMVVPFIIVIILILRYAARLKKENTVSVTICITITAMSALWDIVDSLFFTTGVALTEAGFFVLLLWLAIILINRFLKMNETTLRLNQELTEQKNAFFRFVPHDFLHHLNRESLTDVDLGDNVNKIMSVLFSDIRSFTTLSENMTPEENFRFLNGYLWRMEPYISKYNGFVDKYMGDAILALYAEPEDEKDNEARSSADCALHSAFDMRRELIDYNQSRCERGVPPIEFGIGINTGPLMLGTVGSEHRIDTTVIGNTVNLASRLEGLTVFYRNSIIISDNTFRALTDPYNHHVREIDSVLVKGKKDPVVIYEIFDTDLPDIIELKEQTNPDIAMGIIHYKTRNFKEAYELFRKAYHVYPEDRLVRIYLKRCKFFIENPPPDDWIGVVRFEKKEM